MNSSRPGFLTIAPAVLLASLLPSFVAAAGSSAGPSAAEPQFYLLQAKPLGYSLDDVAVHFEYRSGERVLGADDVLMGFGKDDAVLVPIPSSSWFLFGDTVPNLELLVFADGLLFARFDRASLLAYNRVLGYTHAEQVAALSGKPPETGDALCDSPCGGGCRPYEDYDCDGVINSVDNCTDDYNPDQEDCDGDGYGDVCDVIDATYQPTGAVKTCMTDKDNHVAYFTFEHHVEQQMVDVSSCGAPAIWNRWIRSDADCSNVGDEQCCLNGIGTSISQVGDQPPYWCGDFARDVDFCH